MSIKQDIDQQKNSEKQDHAEEIQYEEAESQAEDDYDELAEPPHIEPPAEHVLWPQIRKALRSIYDPEIPVNIYELGLIYLVDIQNTQAGKDTENSATQNCMANPSYDVYVRMTLTSPGCPVAQEMPTWVQGALFEVHGVQDVDVEIVWDPIWDPSYMAETAKLQLNMFT